MSFVIEDAWLPATLTAPPMTDTQFAEFCAEHPDLFFEMTAEGELIVMPPTFSLTGMRNAEIARQLGIWAMIDRKGVATDSSTGFVLPNGARRSADAAWTEKRRIRVLGRAGIEGYLHLCPDFVIELRSDSDRLSALRAKMREWVENGASLAWMVDPQRRVIEVFRPDREPENSADPNSIDGEGPVAGFRLDLTTVWDPLAD